MNLKKISGRTKKIARIMAFATLLQGAGCKNIHSNTFSQEKLSSSLTMTSLSSDQKKEFIDLMKDYAANSPSARKILSELAFQKASLRLFDQKPDKDNLFRAGESDENALSLNTLIKEKGISLENTFFHEAEHVVHLKKAHTHGINARSFSSLNDIYVYVTLLEALAYRKAALCCMERHPNGLSKQEILQKAEDIFVERFSTKNKNADERLSYEKDAIKLANAETNRLSNQIYFKKKPDWNKIVTLLSREEVNKIPPLPQPTLTFMGVCLLREIIKNPEAEKVEDLEIPCILENKSSLQKDEKAIKVMIADLVMETYNMCWKTKRPFPKKTYDIFLKLMGWPSKEQIEQVKQKRVTLKEVRDSNLEKFKTETLFDEAQKLLLSPEVKAFGIPDIQIFAKILHFEKMILISPTKLKIRLEQEKTR